MIKTLVVEKNFRGSMRDVFYDLAENPNYFPKYFKGFAPFVPGIRKITPQWTGQIVPGGVRKVDLSDGSFVMERVTVHEPPRLQKYEMAELNSMQKLVCQKMHAEYSLEDKGEFVHVKWTYWIETEKLLQKPLVAIVGWAFHQAMHRFMDAASSHAR